MLPAVTMAFTKSFRRCGFSIVAGVDDGFEIGSCRAAARCGRGARVAEETVERGRTIGGHDDAGNTERMDLGGVDVEVVDAVFEGGQAIGAVVGVADEGDRPGSVVAANEIERCRQIVGTKS
jgi:hypothetical protein